MIVSSTSHAPCSLSVCHLSVLLGKVGLTSSYFSAVCGGRERVDVFQGRATDFLDDDNDDDYEEGLCTHLYPVNCFAIKYPHGKCFRFLQNFNSNPADPTTSTTNKLKIKFIAASTTTTTTASTLFQQLCSDTYCLRNQSDAC